MYKSNLIIVIVNHGNANDTVECIQSLYHQLSKEVNVIIVDNSEGLENVGIIKNWIDGNCESIDSRFPNVLGKLNEEALTCNYVLDNTEKKSLKQNQFTLLKCPNNGFAAANNLAVETAKSNNWKYEYIWFLNNDTIVSNYAIGSIDDFLQRNLSADFIGTSLMEYDDPSLVQSVASGFDTRTFRTKSFDSLDSVPSSFEIYPNGASFLLSSNFIDKVGGLNEIYFLYFEELDLVLRAKQKGIIPLYHTDEIVFHKGGGSTGKNSRFADFYYLRSRFLLVSQYFPSKLWRVILLSIVMYPINRILRGQFNRVTLVFSSLISFNRLRNNG